MKRVLRLHTKKVLTINKNINEVYYIEIKNLSVHEIMPLKR